MVSEEKLVKMQKEVDELYKKNNNQLNDEILEKQLKINIMRNESNIPDRKEIVHGIFVQ